ncbi:Tn3 family transposase [Anoxynatronum sibiricum]|uniref:Tn3 family transposase n=1 Tax=Anoxynatronum sibiricum TaxID=210623 RepID=UPI0031B85B3B
MAPDVERPARDARSQDQLMRASALNILINAISIWNTVYLQEAVSHLNNNGGFDEELLKKISPLRW